MMANAVWTAHLVAVNAPGIARGWGLAPGRSRVAAAQGRPDMLRLAEVPDLPAAAQAANIVAEAVTIVTER